MTIYICLRNRIVKLLSFISKRPLVVLVDFDRALTLTLGTYTEYGFFADRWMPFNFARVRLMPNNKTKGVSYVESWYYYKGGTC
jgi:hypothetical protein